MRILNVLAGLSISVFVGSVQAGTIDFQLDDGNLTGTVGLNTDGQFEYASIYLNRFAIDEPLVIDSISIYWEGSSLAGLRANLVAYYDADGDGDPSNAVRLGSDTFVTIDTTGQFEMYPVSFVVPGAGDIYIGFVDDWAFGGYSPVQFPGPISGDDDQHMSFIAFNPTTTATNVQTLGANTRLGVIDDVSGGLFQGNWMIRATASIPPDCVFAAGFDNTANACSQ